MRSSKRQKVSETVLSAGGCRGYLVSQIQGTAAVKEVPEYKQFLTSATPGKVGQPIFQRTSLLWHDRLLVRRIARATESCTRSRHIALCFEHESHAGAAYSGEGRTRLRKRRVRCYMP